MHKNQSHLPNPVTFAHCLLHWGNTFQELQLKKVLCSEPQDTLVLNVELGSSYFFLRRSLECLLLALETLSEPWLQGCASTTLLGCVALSLTYLLWACLLFRVAFASSSWFLKKSLGGRGAVTTSLLLVPSSGS